MGCFDGRAGWVRVQVRELLFQVDLSNRSAAEAEDIDIFDAALLKRIAHLAGLDMFSFGKCFNSHRHKLEVSQQLFGVRVCLLARKAHRSSVILTISYLSVDLVFESPQLDVSTKRPSDYRAGLELSCSGLASPFHGSIPIKPVYENDMPTAKSLSLLGVEYPQILYWHRQIVINHKFEVLVSTSTCMFIMFSVSARTISPTICVWDTHITLLIPLGLLVLLQ